MTSSSDQSPFIQKRARSPIVCRYLIVLLRSVNGLLPLISRTSFYSFSNVINRLFPALSLSAALN